MILKEKAVYIGMVSQVGATYYNIVKADKLIELQEQIVQDRKQIFELIENYPNIPLVSGEISIKNKKVERRKR